MTIVCDIAHKHYMKLIQYASDHSDAVMLTWAERDLSKPIKTVADWQREALEFSPSFPITLQTINRWKEKEECERSNIQILKFVRTPFIEQLSPYVIKTRHDTQWPSTKILECNSTYTVALYRICEELVQLLSKPGSYLSWRYPRYPEDLSFFKDNRCWLYASSHEGYIEFLPRSQEEYDFVSSLGVELPEPYRPIEDIEYYWEDYSL